MKVGLLSALVGLILFQSAAVAQMLTLESYIDQVKKNNESVQAAELSRSGAELRANEAELPLSPMFIANGQYLNDSKPTSSPLFLGDKTIMQTATAGVSQLTPWGMSAKLTYNLNYTEIQGVNPLFVPQSKYYDAKPMIEISQPLWKNFLGAETRAQRDLVKSNTKAVFYRESYNFKLKAAQAEAAYVRLALARESVNVQKASYERSTKLRDWNKRRVQTSLGERADLIQAEAALQLRQLDMQLAMNEEMSASRAFNSLRSLAATEVKESLELITPEKIKALAKVSRATTPREDISSAIAMLEATEANAELGYQRARPTLEVFGSYAYNGRDGELSNANKDAFDSHHPTWLAGLRFSTSFDFGNAYDVREGYLREQQAAELNLHRLMFDEQQDWLELQQRYDDILVRFAMIQSVEEIQKQKMDTERDRFNRGRTTTYQVLMFEQDYALAQLSRIRAQSELMQLLTQLKLYASDAATGGAQ